MLERTTRQTAILIALVSVFAGVVAGSSMVAVQQDDPEDGPEPEDYDENESPIAYDRGNYELTVTPANDSTIEYEIVFVGTVEPANETAAGTVECIGEYCVLSGEIAPEEEAVYNASGMLFGVAPQRILTVGVEGSFDGDAAVGLGWGLALEENASEGTENESVELGRS